MKKLLLAFLAAFFVLIPSQKTGEAAAPSTYYGQFFGAGFPVYDVKYYGAKGDGVTDDTVAIQSAITADVAGGGGTVYFPPGSFKTTSTLTFKTSGIGVQYGGILVEGAGIAGGTINLGSTILANFPSGDVFYFKSQDAVGNYVGPAGVTIRTLSVSRNAVTATSGATFHFEIASPVDVGNVTTESDWDVLQYGLTGIGTGGGVNFHDSSSNNVYHDFYNQTGTLGNAGLHLHDLTAYGNTSAAASLQNRCIDFDGRGATDGTDPLYITNVDCEIFAYGFEDTVGFISDAFIDNLILDCGAGAPAFNVGAPSGQLFDANITGLYACAGNHNGVQLSGWGGALNIVGVRISNSFASTGGTGALNGFFIGDGASGVTLSNDDAYSNSNCGVAIYGSTTTKNVVITGGHYGNNGSSTNGSGICVAPATSSTADKVTITGVDLTGNTSAAMTVNDLTSGSTITNLNVTGNNMTGYTFPMNFLGTPAGVYASNLGYNVASGVPSGACPNGSGYTNSAGGAGFTNYTCTGNTWHAATTP